MKSLNDKKSEMEQLIKLIEYNVQPVNEFGLFNDSNIVDVNKIAVCVFPTLDVTRKAKELGVEFLVSHYMPGEETKSFILNNGMNGYTANLYLDLGRGEGYDGGMVQLALGLCFIYYKRQEGRHVENYKTYPVHYKGKLITNGLMLGNIQKSEDVDELKISGSAKERLENIVKNLVSELDEEGGRLFDEELKYYGFELELDDHSVIALSSLYPIEPSFLREAKEKGANVFIGGGLGTHVILTAKDLGMHVYDLGQYRIKIPGMLDFAVKNLAVFIPNTPKEVFDPYGMIYHFNSGGRSD